MQIPLQITFREVPHSDAIEAHIRDRAGKLESFYEKITSCRVVVGMIQKHRHQGKLYNIRVDVTVPQGEFVINRDRAEDVYVAIRDAFDAARRRLEDYGRRQRGEVKAHELPLHGKVVRLFPEEGYGFIETPDGKEIYFHRYAVTHPDFDQLTEGTEVTFLEEPAAEGTQANRVSVGKHGYTA
jgi:ribosomal subunit interface protein